MKTQDRINKDFMIALKGGERDKKTFLGLVRTEIILNEGRGIEATDENVIKVLKKLAKSIKENIDNGDQDAEQELKWLSPYLPKLMSESEIQKELHLFLSTCPADKMNIGYIMGHFNKNFSGKIDNKILSGLIREMI